MSKGILLFIVEPLDGQTEVELLGGENEVIKDSNGFDVAWIQKGSWIKGKVSAHTITTKQYLRASFDGGKQRGEGWIAINEKLTNVFAAFNLATTPPTLMKSAVPWESFASLGAEAPDFFIDPFGNLCRKDNTIVFRAENKSK